MNTQGLSPVSTMIFAPLTKSVTIICPDLCNSIKPLENSRYFFICLGSISMIATFTTLILLGLQVIDHTRKIPLGKVYLFSLSSVVFYILAFALYYSQSNFSHFDDTHHDPYNYFDIPSNIPSEISSDNFTWGFGLVVSPLQMIAMIIDNFFTVYLIFTYF